MKNGIHFGDCREIMRGGPEGFVQTCVTSPPYFGLRDYGHADQLGLEETPEEYVAAMVEVFREVRRVLRDDGTLWLNIGDTYAGKGGRSVMSGKEFESRARGRQHICRSSRVKPSGEIKQKDLIGIPWMLAFALRADGWYLRQDIIWNKPNPMPESVRDRCTKAHEYLFLLSKSEKYYFDGRAIAQPIAESSRARLAQPNLPNQKGSDRVPGKTNGPMKAVGPRFGGNKYGDDLREESRTKSGNEYSGGGWPRQPPQRLDDSNPALQGRAFRYVSGSLGRALHSCRSSSKRHRARPLHGQRHDRSGGLAQWSPLPRVRTEPGLCPASRRTNQQGGGIARR